MVCVYAKQRRQFQKGWASDCDFVSPTKPLYHVKHKGENRTQQDISCLWEQKTL